jgi:tryptophan-rich sensory protein
VSYQRSKVRALIRLTLAVAICEIAGAIGSLFTAPAIQTWYAGLKKPVLAPPNWVFAPVWITLYLLMGISLFIVWNAGLGKTTVRKSIAIFSIQLVLNVLWSYLFFGLRSPLLGLAGIMAMWFMIVLTVVSFSRISKTAALVLIPYLIWVSFASYLNYSILTLNP